MLIFESPAEHLADALQLVSRAVAQRDQVPSLTGVLLRATEGELELTATDGELAIRTTVPAEVESQGTVLVPARTFSDLLRLVPAQAEVEFRGLEGQVGIRFLRSRFDLPTLRSEEFPPLDFSPQGDPVLVRGEGLKELVRKTGYAVSARDDGRLFTIGMHLSVRAGHLSAATTDNHRLAWAQTPVEGAGEDREILVPARPFAEVVRTLPDEEVEIFFSDSRLIVRTHTMTTYVTAIRAQFPDTSRVVFENYATKVVFDVPSLLQAVERTQLVTDQRNARLRLRIDEEIIRVSANSSEGGQGSEEVPAQSTGQAVDLVFGPKYLIDALRSLHAENAVLEVMHAESPALFRPDVPERNQFAIVMPLRQAES
ncbi:MAG: DNA polymerase III subunit beta [Thermaerobacter sp.]|nr:DNA polymerase III subunit beta [Thermaerobacter sp.]